ncbi:MAG: C25 family cysteine peptidase [Bacteroidia bacterium]|nr:C25 family cysteine peptidase [Bacteroidia bacterium]
MSRLLKWCLWPLLLGAAVLQGQPFDYGNDWYRNLPGRTFVKLAVDQDGIYRVSLADLQAAGHDLSTVDARTLRLFYRGREVPLFVQRSGTALIYFEFLGLRNDGRVDSLMYRDPISGIHRPDLQPSKYFSLFTDESAYFLTWGGTPSGNRFFSVFDPTYSLYTPEPHLRVRSLREYLPGDPQAEYVYGGGGPYDAFYTLNSDFVTGEGYVGPDFAPGSPTTVRIRTPFAANTANPVRVEMRVFGRSNTPHLLRVVMNGNTGSPLLDTSYVSNNTQIYIKTYTREVTPASALTANTDLTFSSLRNGTDNNHVCWAAISYDRLPNLGGDSTLWIRGWNKASPAFIRLEQVRGQDTVMVYDFANRIRYKGLITASGTSRTASVIVQGAANARDLLVVTDRAIRKPRIAAHALSELHNPAAGAEYLIIANRALSASAEAYAQYRDTATVTPVSSVRVVYTDQIYDEFGYGSVTPWAIKRFCKYAFDFWQVKPRYVLLWGKGVINTRQFGNLAHVPTFGYPATDYEYVSHFDETTNNLDPEAAIGRVNLYGNEEGFNYLRKVDEYEHSEWQGWMKEGVFLGGGATEGEQNSISSAFSYMLDIYEGAPLGGQPHYFQKNSASIVIDPTTASYHDEISNGVGVVHFFGHSTSNILDISIRQPFEYTNWHRYPFMVAMGCYGGDFTEFESFGERWVKQPDRGAIGYLANSSAGYLVPLKDYGQVMYNYLVRELPGREIGIVIRETFQKYTDSLSGIMYRNHSRQLNLQGDPAVKLKAPQRPDLEITQSGVFFTPEGFTALDDSVKINLVVSNYGQVTADSFAISVRQTLPSGDLYSHPLARFPMVKYRDTLSFFLQNPVGAAATGLNYFEVWVDAEEVLDEYSETNNRVTVSRQIQGNVPAILYPSQFAIVGESRIQLKASTFFMTRDAEVGYIFEMDTTDRFDSPFRLNSGVVYGTAQLVAWEPPVTLTDSTVYFWRVRLSEVSPAAWSSASFKYILDREGWAQAHFAQFKADGLTGLVIDPVQQEWEFNQFGAGYEFSTRRNGGFSYSINGSLQVDVILNGYYQNGVAWVIIDQYTLKPVYRVETFQEVGLAAAPQELYKLRDAILSARTGDYIIVGSHLNPKVHLWPQDVFQALAQIGVSENLQLLQDGDAFMVMGRKGYPNSATEVYSPNFPPKLVISQLLLSTFDRGEIASPRIGPSLEWKQLFWGWRSKDAVVQELAEVSVFGIRADGSDTLLRENLRAGTHDLSGIDASVYRYLRLRSDLRDTITRTAPQMDNWHILYTPAPDAVVDPLTNYSFRADTVYEGQEVSLHMAARNLGGRDMDSVLVRFTVERADRTLFALDSLVIARLSAGGTPVEFDLRFSTLERQLEGLTQLIVEVNPGGRLPELHLFNNRYVQPFYVKVDRENPLLDVTFDGKRIIDGDIISPKPEILVQVNDENPYLALNDSANFELYFRKGVTAASDFERIFIASDPRVLWQPGQLPQNKARLYFYPGKDAALEDGEYTLRVQGRDQKGNAAGKGENFYEIRFRVENASTITQVLNYPNPFSTSTRFVYTLTGSELPEVFQIHIYTISGKMVKLIDLGALGEVRFGRNITDYAWDGTDEYGDRLANGVYLYKVVLRMRDRELELRDTGVNQYFNNGWGKMYLMR